MKLGGLARRLRVPLVVAALGGAQDGTVFTADSVAFSASEELLARPIGMGDEVITVDTNRAPTVGDREVSELDELWEVLAVGLRDYVRKSGHRSVVLGLSGGLDSALTLVLAVEALGVGAVSALSMPTTFNTVDTRAAAACVAATAGCRFEELPIEDLRVHIDAVAGGLSGVAAENAQARLRALLLMARANTDGSLLLCCSNKSESAVGYSTLYGDSAGAFSPLGDIYKTQVFALAHYLNHRGGREVIPEWLITRAPSAELSEGQFDSDSLPDYQLLDRVLSAHIERGMEPDEIALAGICDRRLAARVVDLVAGAEFKRAQAPPMTQVSAAPLTTARRRPIVDAFRWPV